MAAVVAVEGSGSAGADEKNEPPGSWGPELGTRYERRAPVARLVMLSWDLFNAAANIPPFVRNLRLATGAVWLLLACMCLSPREEHWLTHGASVRYFVIYLIVWIVATLALGCPDGAGTLFTSGDCAAIGRHEVPGHYIASSCVALMAVAMTNSLWATNAQDIFRITCGLAAMHVVCTAGVLYTVQPRSFFASGVAHASLLTLCTQAMALFFAHMSSKAQHLLVVAHSARAEAAFKLALTLERAESKAAAAEAAEAARRRTNRWTAQIAHDFGTPLTALSLSLQMMSDSQLPAAQREKFLHIASTAVATITMQRQMIMDESKLMLGQLLQSYEEAFSVRAVVEDTTATLLHRQAKSRGVALSYHFAEALPPRIVSDPRWILSMSTNYLSNAIRHASSKVMLRVLLETSRPVGGRAMLRIEVHDDGTGVSPELLPSLFRSALRSHSDGNGLGLASVKTQCEIMGGRCGVGDSQMLEGACFWLSVPFRAARAGKATKAAKADTKADGQPRHACNLPAFQGKEGDPEPSLPPDEASGRERCGRVEAASARALGGGGGDEAERREERMARSAAPTATAAGSACSDTVLIIDDDPLIREVFDSILRASGFAVQLAASGDAGLRLMQGKRFLAVITDIQMGKGLTGFELVKEFRQFEAQAQGGGADPTRAAASGGGGRGGRQFVMGMSAGKSEDMLIDAGKAGMDAFINKPVSKAVLLDILRDQQDGQASGGRRRA